jgi:hypothetical protein
LTLYKVFSIKISRANNRNSMLWNCYRSRCLSYIERIIMIKYRIRSICIECTWYDWWCDIKNTISRSKVLYKEFSMNGHNKLLGDIGDINLINSIRYYNLKCTLINIWTNQTGWIRIMVQWFKCRITVCFIPSYNFNWCINIETINECCWV